MKVLLENSSFKEQITFNYNDLLRYGYRLTRNYDDAQDLVQETYSKAYSNIDKFALGTNARAWLFKILYNQFCSLHRKKSVILERTTECSNDECPVVQVKISKAEITESIYKLDTKYKIVSILFFEKEFTYNEINRITDLKLGTVKSRIYRSRELLRDEINQKKRMRSYQEAV